MSFHPLMLGLFSVVLSVAAQFALKAGMRGMSDLGLVRQLLQPMVLFGLFLYGLSALVWLSVLARLEVSKAYPLVGVGFVLTVAVGALVGEQVNVWRWVGVLLICSGVYCIGRS